MGSRAFNQDIDPFFPLIFAVADFTQQLSVIHERHADDLQILVEAFRKRNADLRKERSSFPSALFTLWELLLQEVEVDSQIHGDMSRCLSRNLGTGLKEKTFHRKFQSRKVFIHRASLDALLGKAEDLLKKTQSDYVAAYDNFCVEQTDANLITYYDAHNNYVHQLHAFNGMLKLYVGDVLPSLYEELQEAYLDVSDILACSIHSAAEFLTNKIREQSNHYQTISNAAKSINGRNDIVPYIKALNVDKVSLPSRIHNFVSPALINDTAINANFPPEVVAVLANELYIDKACRYVFRSKLDELKREMNDLEGKIQQLEESLESLIKLQQRSLDSNLHNKANEIQEEICLKKFDLHLAHMQMAAIKSQIELYTAKDRDFHVDNGYLVQRERKSSTTSTTSIKMKWFKAFKSLKSSPVSNNERNDDVKRALKGSSDSNSTLYLYEGQHVWTEYTYKKITPCDVCHEILRGHSRQGMKCKMCKLNCHSECTDKATKCQPKSRLLRRQKSTSEIEAKLAFNELDDEKAAQPTIDPVYQLLRTANEVRRNPSSMSDLNHGINETTTDRFSNLVSSLMPPHHARIRSSASSSNSSSSSHLLAVNNNSMHASCSAPHSPQRKKLSLRMKSFSLDESTQHVQRARPQPNSNHASYNNFASTGSPRKPVFGKIRMNSVDLPNSNEPASASPSPCPSPQQSFNKKPQRLLPTNLYVALYNFRSRHEDELDLKAGTTLTVTDTTDPDWWQGKSHGQTGLFPSKYVAKLYSGERPLQMLHTIQVSDGEGSMVKLLRDQIIIQVGDEIDGIVMIRTGMSDKTISCPAKYVAEVT
ncbi:uncharacterized protein LOC107363641 isoform X2 [Tetranychus urticae]|uniref:uncharacterized protein LOC107363641 isoform X2 n=1 Tax=Tetranychus urticae TaxID=32264 RepID=UPI00077BD078|nr:uncharacterized protein LOC107363641 isoform X2 [Tetranychus urticae]